MHVRWAATIEKLFNKNKKYYLRQEFVQLLQEMSAKGDKRICGDSLLAIEKEFLPAHLKEASFCAISAGLHSNSSEPNEAPWTPKIERLSLDKKRQNKEMHFDTPSHPDHQIAFDCYGKHLKSKLAVE